MDSFDDETVSPIDVLDYLSSKFKEHGLNVEGPSLSEMLYSWFIEDELTPAPIEIFPEEKTVVVDPCYFAEVIGEAKSDLEREGFTWEDYMDYLVEHELGHIPTSADAKKLFRKAGKYSIVVVDILIHHRIPERLRRAFAVRLRCERRILRKNFEAFSRLSRGKQFELLLGAAEDAFYGGFDASELGVPKRSRRLFDEIIQALREVKDFDSALSAALKLKRLRREYVRRRAP